MGIDGNEIADQLAKVGFLHPLLGPKAVSGICAAVVRRAIKDCTSRKLQEFWQSTRGQR